MCKPDLSPACMDVGHCMGVATSTSPVCTFFQYSAWWPSHFAKPALAATSLMQAQLFSCNLPSCSLLCDLFRTRAVFLWGSQLSTSAASRDIPRKGGPAIQKSDLLIINKTDLAPHVDVNLESMKDDVRKARNGLPYVFCQMKKQIGVEQVAKFLFSSGGL